MRLTCQVLPFPLKVKLFDMRLRSTWRTLLGLSLCLLLSGCAAYNTGSQSSGANGSGPAERTLVILHTNDFHGHIAADGESAGAARIGAFFSAERALHNNVLVLDAGDAISGTPVSTLFSGVPIFEVMNAMGYDFGLVGNHEFDHGWRQIQKFRDTAEFPLLAATARGPNGNLLGDMPYQIITRGSLRIAVIGVLTESTPQMITPLGNEGTSFASVAATLRELVAQLHPQVDLVVVLSHTGHIEEQVLASSVPDIDVIVGGHSHTRVTQPLVIGNTVVAQAHEYGKAVGRLELSVSADGVVELVNGRLVNAAELPAPDPDVAAVVSRWERQVAEQVDYDIAQSPRLISRTELRHWMERVLRIQTSADFGYYNKGGVRDAIRPGPVSARTIWKIEPFGNSVVTLTLTGAEVRTMLAVNNDEVAVELDDSKRYRVATNSFVGAHARKTFGAHVNLQDRGVLVRDLLIEAIRTEGLPGE